MRGIDEVLTSMGATPFPSDDPIPIPEKRESGPARSATECSRIEEAEWRRTVRVEAALVPPRRSRGTRTSRCPEEQRAHFGLPGCA
jgi:hypothetical protein